MGRILDIQETYTYKDLKNWADIVLMDKIGNYVFGKYDRSVNKIEIFYIDVLRKKQGPFYRTIWNNGCVNWFKFNHEKFHYLI